MRKKLYNILFYSLACLALNSNSILHGQSSFCFTCSNKGFIALENPSSKNQAWVEINGLAYRPYFEQKKDRFIAWCPGRGLGKLSIRSRPTEYVAPEEVQTGTLNLSSPRAYQYFLVSEHSPDHWFSGIASPDRPCVEALPQGTLDGHHPNTTHIKLHNFGPAEAYVQLYTHHHFVDTMIPESGDFSVVFSDFRKDELDSLHIDALNNNVGFVGMEANWRFSGESASFTPNLPLTFAVEQLPSSPANEKDSWYFFKDQHLLQCSSPRDLEPQKLPQPATFILSSSPTETPELIRRKIKLKKKGDLVIVYHPVFEEVLEEQSSQWDQLLPTNMRIVWVDVRDILLKGNQSLSPELRIKAFLHRIHPEQVLLLGDASSNPVIGPELIPTFYYIHRNQYTRTPSDYSYTYLNQVDEPQFAIGRLPFSTPDQLSAFVLKYSEIQPLRTFVYDEPGEFTALGPLENTEIVQPELQESSLKYPIPYQLKNAPPGQMIFIGHGKFRGWGSQVSTTAEHFLLLADNPPFFLWDLSCWTGEFSHCMQTSFAEKLLAMPHGGSYGTVASSNFASLDGLSFLGKCLARETDTRDIGPFLNESKVEGYRAKKVGYDDLHTINLLGFPFSKWVPLK